MVAARTPLALPSLLREMVRLKDGFGIYLGSDF